MSRTLLSESTEKTSETPESKALLSEKDPAKFDLVLWAQGVKPIERSVDLYQRLDLLAARDELMIDLEDARGKALPTAIGEIKKKITSLTDQIISSRITVRIRGLERSRVQEVLDAAEVAGCTTKLDGELFIVAQQIAEPEGLTYEILKELYELISPQIEKLATAARECNHAVPGLKVNLPF